MYRLINGMTLLITLPKLMIEKRKREWERIGIRKTKFIWKISQRGGDFCGETDEGRMVKSGKLSSAYSEMP